MPRAKKRPERTPVGRRDVLTTEQRPGYKRRIINDEPGRLQMFLDAGYSVVDNEKIGDDNAGKSTALGSHASVSVGDGKNGYLVEIKDEWYQEDQAAKEAQIKEKEQGILLDENGNAPDPKHVYGEGVSINSNKPAVQIE